MFDMLCNEIFVENTGWNKSHFITFITESQPQTPPSPSPLQEWSCPAPAWLSSLWTCPPSEWSPAGWSRWSILSSCCQSWSPPPPCSSGWSQCRHWVPVLGGDQSCWPGYSEEWRDWRLRRLRSEDQMVWEWVWPEWPAWMPGDQRWHCAVTWHSLTCWGTSWYDCREHAEIYIVNWW